jgi:hypothetical protein
MLRVQRNKIAEELTFPSTHLQTPSTNIYLYECCHPVRLTFFMRRCGVVTSWWLWQGPLPNDGGAVNELERRSGVSTCW